MGNTTQRFHKWFIGDAGATGVAQDKYTCGTLHYTPAALATLFGWLLWGDVVFCLMEAMPGLLVMQLGDYEISNQAKAALLTTIFTICNILLNPVISYASDRHRGRWGRRRPFLLFTTPFVTLFLILIPWAPEIAAALMRHESARAVLALCPVAPLVLTFGILIACFQVFNMFTCTVYYYLVPDTVPEPLIGRFMGLFRVCGGVAALGFNWFLFGHAHAHMRLFFAVFGGLYGISFMLMCWKVREGGYPEIKEDHGHWYSPIRNYAGECFGSARNWVVFLIYGTMGWGSAANIFFLYFYRDQIGLSETEYGRLGSIGLIISLVLAAPMGALVDRWGSYKSLIVGVIAVILCNLLCFVGIHGRLSAFVLVPMMSIPSGLLYIAVLKWMVDEYPRAQYGQWGSASAIVGAAGVAVLSPLAGRLLDVFHNNYRMIYLFPAFFSSISLVLIVILSRWPKSEPAEESGMNLKSLSSAP